MIEFSQLSSSEIEITFCPADLDAFLEMLDAQTQSNRSALIPVIAAGSFFGSRAARTRELEVRLGSNDQLIDAAGKLIWEMDPEFRDGIRMQLGQAKLLGHIFPAEMGVVEDRRGRYVRLFGRLHVPDKIG